MVSTAGLMLLQQFLRPLRFFGAVALTPVVGKFIKRMEQRLKVNQRTAGAIMLGILAFSTLTVLSTALVIATILNMPKTA
jgi:hypothetical protein